MRYVGGKFQNASGIELDQIGFSGHERQAFNWLVNPIDRPRASVWKGDTMSFDAGSLTFNEAGLIPAIAQDHETNEILMMAWMNKDAVERTLETGRVTYWSRSRSAFWIKGETSGHTQELVDLRIDCDRDALLVLVRQVGAACHTNRRSCFYTAVREGNEKQIMDVMS